MLFFLLWPLMHFYSSYLRSKETEFNYCNEGRCLKYENNRKSPKLVISFLKLSAMNWQWMRNNLTYDKNSLQRNINNVLFTMYNCCRPNSLDSHNYFLSNTAFNILKSGQRVKQVNACTFTLDMLFNGDFFVLAESDQETALLSIDKSSDKCEVGRFVLTCRIKTGNSSSVLQWNLY